MFSQFQPSQSATTAQQPPTTAITLIYAQPGVPYLTPARSAAPHYIDPHLEFIPTTHEHLHAMCASNDYSTVTDAITPAHLNHLDMMDLRRIFWLIELQGDLRELCRVDRTMTYNELLAWASTPHIAAILMTPRLHPDCYLPAQPVGRTSGAAACHPTPQTTSRSTAAAAKNTQWSERDSTSRTRYRNKLVSTSCSGGFTANDVLLPCVNSLATRLEPSVPLSNRTIPTLPARPRSPSIVPYLWRSYPVGRQEFSRAVVGQPLKLSFWTNDHFPKPVLAMLDTTLNAPNPDEWMSVPFEESDDTAFTCCITPTKTGLYSFRARCSFDGGMTWIRDPVPDAWVLVDPPQIDGLRLYTLIPAVSGSLADWINDLPRIKAMGFNAVHMLPVTTLDVSQSPYAASDLFDVEHRYLTSAEHGDGLTQLEAYVQRARELNMGLCFDLVLNHIGVQSAMVNRAPEWIVPDASRADGNKRARYWADGKWRAWDDLVLINYEHPSEIVRAELWAYMIEYALFWGKYADATGGFVRFDNLHSGNPRFVEAVTRALREAYPSLGIIAEYFTDEGTLLSNVPDWRLNLVMAMPWNSKFVPDLRAYLQYLHRISDHVRYFMPITSHDSGSPAQEFGGPESTVPRYVAAALLGTGATGIVQGVESGVAEKVQFIGPSARMMTAAQPRFAKFLAAVNGLLAEHEAFRTGGNCQFVDHGHDAIIAAYRRNPGLCFDSTSTGPAAEGGFLVVCNFDTRSMQQIELDLTRVLGGTGQFVGEELLTGSRAQYEAAQFTLTLPPCGAMVIRFDRRR